MELAEEQVQEASFLLAQLQGACRLAVCVVVSFSEVHKMKQPMVAKEPVLVQNSYQSTNKKFVGY